MAAKPFNSLFSGTGRNALDLPVADRQVAQACDPDGSLDERDPVDKVELSLGSRNAATGLTGFKGFLDDLGVNLKPHLAHQLPAAVG